MKTKSLLNILILTIVSTGLITLTGCANKAENAALIGAAIGENEDNKDRQRAGY